MVSTQLKNISQNGNLPQIEVKIKKMETTTQKSIVCQISKGGSTFMVSFCEVFHSNLSKKRLMFGDDHPTLSKESLVDLIETTFSWNLLRNQKFPNLQKIEDIWQKNYIYI